MAKVKIIIIVFTRCIEQKMIRFRIILIPEKTQALNPKNASYATHLNIALRSSALTLFKFYTGIVSSQQLHNILYCIHIHTCTYMYTNFV